MRYIAENTDNQRGGQPPNPRGFSLWGRWQKAGGCIDNHRQCSICHLHGFALGLRLRRALSSGTRSNDSKTSRFETTTICRINCALDSHLSNLPEVCPRQGRRVSLTTGRLAPKLTHRFSGRGHFFFLEGNFPLQFSSSEKQSQIALNLLLVVVYIKKRSKEE